MSLKEQLPFQATTSLSRFRLGSQESKGRLCSGTGEWARKSETPSPPALMFHSHGMLGRGKAPPPPGFGLRAVRERVTTREKTFALLQVQGEKI